MSWNTGFYKGWNGRKLEVIQFKHRLRSNAIPFERSLTVVSCNRGPGKPRGMVRHMLRLGGGLTDAITGGKLSEDAKIYHVAVFSEFFNIPFVAVTGDKKYAKQLRERVLKVARELEGESIVANDHTVYFKKKLREEGLFI